MDRLGRKTLHLSGLSLMAFWTALMTLMLALRHQFPKSSSGEAGMVYTCVVCVFLFVGSFAIGPGAIPWFITAEMFTQASRGAAMTVCVAVNWICQIFIAQIYPTMLVSKITGTDELLMDNRQSPSANSCLTQNMTLSPFDAPEKYFSHEKYDNYLSYLFKEINSVPISRITFGDQNENTHFQ